MRFLVDECIGPKVADWLHSQGYEVFSVYDQARGKGDDFIIKKAFDENWILLTSDKDFGEKAYHEKKPHHGIILLRLDDERSKLKIEALKRLLHAYADRIPDQFVVVTGKGVRFAKEMN